MIPRGPNGYRPNQHLGPLAQRGTFHLLPAGSGEDKGDRRDPEPFGRPRLNARVGRREV